MYQLLSKQIKNIPNIERSQRKRINIMKNKLHNNNCNINKSKSIQPQKQNTDIDPPHQNTKWATFTKQTKKLQKKFKDTNKNSI
jgi:hypothetical protein